jgi:hypothetical protein
MNIRSEVHRVTLWLKAGWKPDALDLVEKVNKRPILVQSGESKPTIFFVPGPSGNELEVRVGAEWLLENLPECYAEAMVARLRGEKEVNLSPKGKPLGGFGLKA